MLLSMMMMMMMMLRMMMMMMLMMEKNEVNEMMGTAQLTTKCFDNQTMTDDDEPRTVQPSQASWSWSSSGGSNESDSDAKGKSSMAVTAGVSTLLVVTYQLGSA